MSCVCVCARRTVVEEADLHVAVGGYPEPYDVMPEGQLQKNGATITVYNEGEKCRRRRAVKVRSVAMLIGQSERSGARRSLGERSERNESGVAKANTADTSRTVAG